MTKGANKIDRLDREILGILLINARISLKNVTTQCGVSCAAIYQCVQHLVEEGIVTGNRFYANLKNLGYSTYTYVGLNPGRGSMHKKVVAGLQEILEIIEYHLTTDPYTMMIKLYARDNEQPVDLLNNRMQIIPGVVSTETLISLEQSIKREIPANVDEE